MDVAIIEVSGILATTTWTRAIPSGIIGARILFRYTDPEWDNLVKNVIIRHGGTTRMIIDATNVVELPKELVEVPSAQPVWVGVYGVSPDGSTAIPTLWAPIGIVRNAADPSRDPTSDSGLPIWAQLLLRIEALEKSKDTEVDLNDFVRSVNGIAPDENGNVVVSGGMVSTVEPADDDIPKVFFGGALQQTKDEKVVSFRYISKTEDIRGYAEIKAQGNSSMNYPKKNQTVKLFKDAECTEKLKVDFKGWGKQNKHVYKANWIDLTHARNVVSARLWADVVKSRSNYAELPELLRTSPNQGAVDGFPVKVYADGVYQGRYTLNIPKDKWAFNMDDSLANHCVLCGENYVSGCFRASANINGSDWSDEIHDSVPASIKTRWNEVISFVMNSTDEEFRANLGNYFYVDSLIDYHLFGLASCGLDAYGKNQLYMTYDGQKWFASMYDMDSTWGLYWNGSKFVSTSYTREEYEDMISDREGNLLYIRLEQLFHEELQTRWAELKNSALSITNIINRFERFTDIAPAELVKEDYASTTGGGKFTGIPSQATNNIQQIRAFALERQAWTDDYVENMGSTEPDKPDEPDTPDEPENPGIVPMTKGGTLGEADGFVTENQEYGYYSGYVKVNLCEEITVIMGSGWAGVWLYDEAKTPIVKIAGNESQTSVPITFVVNRANAKYTRFSCVGSASVDCSTAEVLVVDRSDEYEVLTNGVTIKADGTVSSGTAQNYATEDYYPVSPGETYVITCANVWLSVAGYNSEKVFVSTLNTATATDKTATVTIPEGVKYIRWGCTGGNVNVLCTIQKAQAEIDYTLNPLENVTFQKGYVYDQNTGEVVANNNNSYSSKFTLQGCVYKMTATAATYISVSVWDEDGNYLGRTNEGNAPTFIGVPGWTYGINYYDPNETNVFTLMPVDNSENKTKPFTIDLTTGWEDNSAGAQLPLDDIFNEYGITGTNQINSVGEKIHAFIGVNGTKASTMPMISIFSFNGSWFIRSNNKTTATDASAYYAEHCPTLTING